jgi:hypothetical protein
MKIQKSFTPQEKQNIVKPNVDVFDGDIIKILDEGDWLTFNYKNQQIKKLVFKIQTKFKTEKLLPLNQQSINNLIDAYGEETKDWIGKEVKVWIFKSNIGGKFVDVIYLTHPGWGFNGKHFVKKNEEKISKN